MTAPRPANHNLIISGSVQQSIKPFTNTNVLTLQRTNNALTRNSPGRYLPRHQRQSRLLRPKTPFLALKTMPYSTRPIQMPGSSLLEYISMRLALLFRFENSSSTHDRAGANSAISVTATMSSGNAPNATCKKEFLRSLNSSTSAFASTTSDPMGSSGTCRDRLPDSNFGRDLEAHEPLLEA